MAGKVAGNNLKIISHKMGQSVRLAQTARTSFN
jgi:hypothetical protein